MWHSSRTVRMARADTDPVHGRRERRGERRGYGERERERERREREVGWNHSLSTISFYDDK